MKNIYDFTADEKRWIAEAQGELINRLRAIAGIHQIGGNISLSPDGSGLAEAKEAE